MEESVMTYNKKPLRLKVRNQCINFVKAGEVKKREEQKQEGILSTSNDWIILADVGDEHLTFPVSIYATPLRPDIVVFSMKTKKVIMVELTCPKEERMSISNQLKRDKYNKELVPGCQRNGWQAYLFPVEVGCRGFVSKSLDGSMRAVGMSGSKIKELKKNCSKSALRSSYNIWIQRKKRDFSQW